MLRLVHPRSLHVAFAILLSAACIAQSTWRVDSLMNSWPVQQAMQQARSVAHPGVIKAVDTRDLYAKLQRNITGFPVFADSAVVRYVDLYGEPRREQFRALLGAAQHYFPTIEAQLAQSGLPKDLKYLPMAMSAMNTLAGSQSGEAGLWMLSYPVALRYGLTITTDVDERRDALLSTMVAMRYLKDLHAQYNDWGLTVMAFACGPANVTRARQRASGANDMRSLYPHFTTGHREVLPQMMAFMHLATNAKDLGIVPIPIEPMEPSDAIRATKELRFDALAKTLGMPIARLRAINPMLSADRVPAMRTFALPRGGATQYAQLADSIERTQQQLRELALKASTPEPDAVARIADGREAIYYRVRSGDYLGRIADRFGVKVSQIKTWNKLRSDHIDAGDQIVIYVSPTKRVRYEKEVEKSSDDDGPSNQTPIKLAEPAESVKTDSPQRTFNWYTVRSGDSLYGIAKKYPGLDARQLMQYNGISADIKPGQKLKIPLSR